MSRQSCLLPGLILGAGLLTGCTSIHTQIAIDAPPDRVRAIVTDYASYPAWNPFVVKVVGDMSAGKDVQVTVHPVGQALVTGTGHVLVADADRIAWSGHLGLPGVFSGVHTFLIQPDGSGRTLFSNDEKMRGLSVLFYDFGPTKEAFVAMNQALKQRAEVH
jgi:hypothetical protein